MKPLAILGAVFLASVGLALATYPGYVPAGYGGYGYPGGQSSFLSENTIFIFVLFFFLFLMMTPTTTSSTTPSSSGGVVVMPPSGGGNTPPFRK